MSDQRIIGSMRSYGDLIGIIRARMAELNVSHETLDEIAGLQSGYTGKLLARTAIRRMSPWMQFLIFDALGLVSHVVEDAERVAQMRPRLTPKKQTNAGSTHNRSTHNLCPDFLHIRARMGGFARARKMTQKQLRNAARKAARIRWQKAAIALSADVSGTCATGDRA